MANVYSGKVLKGPLRVRKNPEIKPGNIVNLINKDRELIIYEISGDWVRHDQGGWSNTKDYNDILIEVYKKEAISLKSFEPQDVSCFRLAFDEYDDDDKICEYDEIYPDIKFDDKDEKDKKRKKNFESLTKSIEKQLGQYIGSEDNEDKYLDGSSIELNIEGTSFPAIKNNSKWIIRISKSSLTRILDINTESANPTITVDNDNSSMITDPNEAKSRDIASEVEFYNVNFSSDDLEALQNNSTVDLKAFINEAPKIFGMPYQFDEISDPRPKGTKYGKKYLEKMVVQMPLLYITPGTPKFLPGADKGNVLTAVADLITGDAEQALTTLSDLFNDDSFKDRKYYTLQFDGTEYYKYVNTACSLLYSFLNLDTFIDTYDINLGGIDYSNYRWQEYQHASMQYLGSGSCIGFYMNSETQTSESFSNASGESSLASTINQAASTVNEFQFLVGSVSGEDSLLKNTFDTLQEGFSSFIQDWGGVLGDTLKARLNDAFQTVGKGGKMIFPKIWQDSSFSRSYSCSFKLSTPDADDFSWFMNIGVPYLHLVCLTAPRQLTTNSFTGPFLVRAYSKGFMNVDMGLITSLSVTKGDRCKWNLNGLPMEIDISLEIEDMYTIMSISKSEDMSIKDFIKNTAMMDYIANMCGVNICKPDFWRHFDMAMRFKIGGMSVLNLSKDIKDVFFNIGETFDNIMNSIYNN